MLGNLKFIDFFSGIGGFRQGMVNSGHKPVGWCEIDKYAQKSYRTLYDTEGEFFNDNVRTIKASELPEADVYTVGFPCFPKGTKIDTREGIKDIEKVKIGDWVLTHQNRYKRVKKTMQKKYNEEFIEIKAGDSRVVATKEHPFYIKEKLKGKFLSKAKWVEANHLNSDCFIGVPRKTKGVLNLNDVEFTDPYLYWIKIEEVKRFEQKSNVSVYNLSVEGDESYAANGFASHNCQSFSVAGRRGGLKDTRGTLIFEVLRLAEKRQPKYLFMENVKGLLSQDGGSAFATILNSIHEVGYEQIEWQVLNSKDFGLPQSRERVFIVAYSGEEPPPEIFPIRRKAKNSIRQIANIEEDIRKRKNPQTGRIYDSEGLSPTLTKVQGGGQIPKILENYEEVRAILTPNRLEKRQNGRRMKEVGEPMFTITKQDKHGIFSIYKGDIKIRELTPLEYWRLQGFSDEDFYKVKNIGMSDSQLYKQAGNSVSIPVIEAIAKKLK